MAKEMCFTFAIVFNTLICRSVIQFSKTMDEMNCEREQNQRVGLMNECEEDVDIRKNRQNAKRDLQSHDAEQPQRSLLDIRRIMLFPDDVEDPGREDDSQPCKPTMDEDNRL